MATMTANELKLDYFQIYDVADRPAEASVLLQGQFDKRPVKMQLTTLDYVANPVSKNGQPLHDKNAHLAWYRGVQPAEPTRRVVLENQFGRFDIRTGRGYGLLVPTQKVELGSAFPEALDHYKVYRLVDVERVPDVTLKLRDQFGASEARLRVPLFLAVPVKKRHGTSEHAIRNERAHLLVFGIGPREVQKKVKLRNQFARGVSAVAVRSVMLAVPSIKHDWNLNP